MGSCMSAANARDRGTSKSSRSGGSSEPARSRGQGTTDLATAVRAAMTQFQQLTGRAPESVTGARSLENGDGWSVLVDVVELDRIPSSTSVIGTYRVDLDEGGSITGYERLRRYTRGATDPT
jgi:Gas vesicle synthesis protein GvpO